MKTLRNNNKGFTLAEVVLTSSVGIIIVASILHLTMVTQRFAAAALNQISVTEAMKKPTEMLARDIREAVRIDYYQSYTNVTPTKNADYIQIFFPSSHGVNNVGYYVHNKELRKITNLAADDANSTADDKLIATGIQSQNTFRDVAQLTMRLKFNIKNDSDQQSGKKTAQVDTFIHFRN